MARASGGVNVAAVAGVSALPASWSASARTKAKGPEISSSVTISCTGSRPSDPGPAAAAIRDSATPALAFAFVNRVEVHKLRHALEHLLHTLYPCRLLGRTLVLPRLFLALEVDKRVELARVVPVPQRE